MIHFLKRETLFSILLSSRALFVYIHYHCSCPILFVSTAHCHYYWSAIVVDCHKLVQGLNTVEASISVNAPRTRLGSSHKLSSPLPSLLCAPRTKHHFAIVTTHHVPRQHYDAPRSTMHHKTTGQETMWLKLLFKFHHPLVTRPPPDSFILQLYLSYKVLKTIGI